MDDLPDGTFVARGAEAWLVHGAQLRRWTPGGYAEAVPRPTGGREDVLTPPSLWIMLGAGVDSALPLLHPSAGGVIRVS